MIRKFCVAGTALWLAACAVGPNYHRPALDVPAKFRGAPEAAQGAAFAELQWWVVLEDPVLQSLIRDALANNYDLRIAANRVLQAREQLGITRASQLPSLGGFVEAERQRVPPQLSDQTIYSGGLQLSWVLDFWGQFRRATEAARAGEQCLCADWACHVDRPVGEKCDSDRGVRQSGVRAQHTG